MATWPTCRPNSLVGLLFGWAILFGLIRNVFLAIKYPFLIHFADEGPPWKGDEALSVAFSSIPEYGPGSKNRTRRYDISANITGENGASITPISKEIERYSINRPSTFFSLDYNDRSGSGLRRMILNHAYAFQNNITYGGACPHPRTKLHAPVIQQHYHDRRKLLEWLGLSDVLLLKCPPGLEMETRPKKPSTNQIEQAEAELVPFSRINAQTNDNPEGLLTPEYVQYLKAQQSTKARIFAKGSKAKERHTIAVHIRRGDVSPCKVGWRYMPNQYFQQLIQVQIERHKQMYPKEPKPRVAIYSESQSVESWDEFRRHGYKLLLDTPLEEAWAGMVHSDVFIMSQSCFSWVPALFHGGATIVYTEFRLKPARGWEVVDANSTLYRSAVARREELENEHCNFTDEAQRA